MRYLAFGLFAYYLLTFGGHQYSIDGILMFQSAKAVVYQQSLVFAPPVLWGKSVHQVSPYGIGMILAYAPFLLLWSPFFLAFPSSQQIPYDPAVAHNPELYANLPYLLCSLLNPTVTALTACFLFKLCRRIGFGPGWALAAALAYGLASPAAAYARYDFSQPLAGLCLTAAIAQILSAENAMRSYLRCGLWLGFAVLTRPDFILFCGWVLVWLAWEVRRSRRPPKWGQVVTAAVPVALAALATLASNRLKFGTIGHPGLTWNVLFSSSLSDVLRGLLGLTVSPGRGLLIYFPLACLAFAGFRTMAHAPCPATRRGAQLIGGVAVTGLLFYGSTRIWDGGWSWGPRYLVPFLPFVTATATAWAAFQEEPHKVRLFLFLVALGWVASLNGVLFDVSEFYRWIEDTGIEPVKATVQFQFAASSLFQGWGQPLDLFLVRTTDPEQLQRFAPLLGVHPNQVTVDLILLARLGAALTAVLLLCVVGWAGQGLVSSLRRTGSGPNEGTRP